jgi:hypothetical protein
LVLFGAVSLVVAAAMIKVAMIKFVDGPPPGPPLIPKKPRPVVTAPATPPAGTVKTPPAAPEPVVAPPAHETAQRELTPTPKTKPHSGEVTTKVTTGLAPGVTATTDSVQAEVEASQAFRTFVADAKVTGVFQGTPSRAFINGRLVRAGEVVDSSLGVRFDSVDSNTKTIVFKDASGAKVSKRY